VTEVKKKKIICYIYSSHDYESTDPITEIWQLFLKVIVIRTVSSNFIHKEMV